MKTIEYVIGAVLLLIAVGLIVSITMQKSRQRGLSASLAGSSAESYYGKNKGMTKQKVLNTITTVLAIDFAVLVLLLYILHPSNSNSSNTTSSEPEQSQTESSEVNVSDTVESAVEESEELSADQSAEPVSE